MYEINGIFGQLTRHYSPNLPWADVEELLYGEDCTDEEWIERGKKFWSLAMTHQAQDTQLQTLRELGGLIRNIRIENQSSYDNTYDNWAAIIAVSPANAYLSYIYTVSTLAALPKHVQETAPNGYNRKLGVQLALSAVSTYLLTLTIPGAKTYGVFDEDVIEHCMNVFKLLEDNACRTQDANIIWMSFVTMCDDLKIVFRYVHFKEQLKARDKILRCLMEILYMNFKHGFVNSCASTLHAKCYELFDEIANEHNGNVEETLHLILRQTFPMHIYPENPQGSQRGGGGGRSEHISDWFISLIAKYPEIVMRVLRFYIEVVVTNPLKAWKPIEEKIAIGYAAKYDAALYSKCNKSCADFVIEAVKADDAVSIQTRALDLIERILQQQSQVEWSIFRYDVSTIPREVTLIKELILSLNDRTFTVRRKACQVLVSSLKQGSAMTLKILDESMRFVQFDDTDVETLLEPRAEGHELRFEKPGIVQYAFSFEGHEHLEAVAKNLPRTIYERFLAADNGLARAAGIALLERLTLINPLIIYNTNFVREMSLLAVDRLSSVRKTALETIETLLKTYCNCFALICVYCRIWACLLNDEDVALQRLAMQSFNEIVLNNIQPLECSNEPKHFMPWRIVSTLLITQPREYLKQRIDVLMENGSAVSSKLVMTIISHLSTSTATEAWALLLLISSRIENNMDVLITHFNTLSSYNMKINQVLALQLTICCLHKFSKPALNNLFKLMIELLRTGNIWLGLISPAINLLKQMDHLSISQSPINSAHDESWLLELLEDVNESILCSAENFQEEHIRIQCLLGTYSELIVMTSKAADERIIGIVMKYLRECTKLSEDNFDTDNERMMNWMIVIAGRLCLRRSDLAYKLAGIYKQILANNDRPQIINNTLIAINDLGHKHPPILENTFQSVLNKLSSKFVKTRVRTFRCVKDVILSGNIKLKGPILISLLATLVDESGEVAREADAFFKRYQRLYNEKIFHHCLREGPFDVNDVAYLNGKRTNPGYHSQLKGAHMVKRRRLLYNHIMSTLDDNTLLLYFAILKLMAEKTREENFVKTVGAIDVIQDLLFIMRRICFITKGKKQLNARGEGEADGDGENRTEIATESTAPTTSETNQPTTPKTSATGKGRGRGRQRDSMEDPIKQLEASIRYVEETHRNLKNVMTDNLQKSFDNFCKALAMRFPSLVEFAQPAQFWNKYRNHPKTPRAKRKRRNEKTTASDETEDEDCSTENESDSDNELPLERHKEQQQQQQQSTNNQQRHSHLTQSHDTILTELLFQPPDW